MGGLGVDGAADGADILLIDDEAQEVDREAVVRLQALLEEERDKSRTLSAHISKIDAFLKVSGMNKELSSNFDGIEPGLDVDFETKMNLVCAIEEA